MKGARNTGHRANEIDAQRAADAVWERWLSKAALKPDLSQALEMSLGPKRPSRKSGKPADENKRANESAGTMAALQEARSRADSAEARLAEAEKRVRDAEKRAAAAEARSVEAEQDAKKQIERLRSALSE